MRTVGFLVLLVASPAVWGFASKDVPSWVEEVATRKLPSYPGKVAAAVLLDDQHVTIDASGMMTVTERHAIKVLNQQGKGEAAVRVPYWKNRREIKDLQAWIIEPGGFQKTFDKKNVLDVGLFNEDALYIDGRARVIAADAAEIGAVFAYEYTVQEKALAGVDEFFFQHELPALQSRYSVTLPAGWTAKAVLFNQSPLQPVIDGTTYTWELKDLPYREADDESSDTAPRLAISFQPPAGTSSATPVFSSWTDVSSWNYSLAEGQAEVTPEISAKVGELTASAKTDYDKICAIGRYVQNIRYVAISMDHERGGGYIPHSADLVFNTQYGDCKDKANLMRCMLKAANIQSYLVAIWSGDRTHVRHEWPSPYQFNHMILAAKVGDSVSAAPVVTSPLGRLLIFDPTDSKTPVGDLPWYEQGSYAMVLAKDHGDLLQMPVTQPEANLYEVTADATLLPNGKLTASVVTKKTGQEASRERHHFSDENAQEYKSYYQRALNENAKGSVISKITPEDHFEQNGFDLTLDFESGDYAQLMQNRLMVFSPAVLEISRWVSPVFPKDEKRAGPVVLRATVYRKTVRVKLPDGFTVDEAPVPANYESNFGKFSLNFKQEAGTLIMTEELRTEAATVPAEDFAALKKFFDNCRGADHQSVVLAKN